MRDFDVQSLYGNISGYIGLFLGYSLFQIPNLLRYLCRIIEERLITKNKKQSSRRKVEYLEEKPTNEQSHERNVDEELKKFNLELYELSQKFQELHALMRK